MLKFEDYTLILPDQLFLFMYLPVQQLLMRISLRYNHSIVTMYHLIPVTMHHLVPVTIAVTLLINPPLETVIVTALLEFLVVFY